MIGQPDTGEGLADPGLAFGLGQMDKTKARIGGDIEPGEEARLLEHDADGGMRPADRLIPDADRAVARLIEAGDEAEHGGLAAAGAADHRRNGAGQIVSEMSRSACVPSA